MNEAADGSKTPFRHYPNFSISSASLKKELVIAVKDESYYPSRFYVDYVKAYVKE